MDLDMRSLLEVRKRSGYGLNFGITVFASGFSLNIHGCEYLISWILSHLPFNQAPRTNTLSLAGGGTYGPTSMDFDITADHLFAGDIDKQIEYVDTILSRPEINPVKFQIKPYPTESHHPVKSLDLEVEGVAVSDATIREVVLSCKYVESLKIQYCMLHEVVVHHRRLASFLLRATSHCVIDLTTPILEELELNCRLKLHSASVLAPRVRKPSIRCWGRSGLACRDSQLGGLVAGIQRTGCLRLGGAMAQVGKPFSEACSLLLRDFLISMRNNLIVNIPTS